MHESSFEGVTVNERLYHFGLIDSFDRAAMARDFEALVEILLQAKLTTEQAEQTARTILAEPARYGF